MKDTTPDPKETPLSRLVATLERKRAEHERALAAERKEQADRQLARGRYWWIKIEED